MLHAVTASTRYSASMLSPGAMLMRLSSRVTYTSVLPSCVTLPAYTKGNGGALGGCGGALARAPGAGGGGAKLFGANGSLPAGAGAVRSSLARSMSEAGGTTAPAGGRAEVAWITSATGFSRPAT